MRIYKISASGYGMNMMGWILGSGQKIAVNDAPHHAAYVLRNPQVFGLTPAEVNACENDPNINTTYCAAMKRGAIRYFISPSISQINFQGTKSSISKNIDTVRSLIRSSYKVYVDYYNTGSCSNMSSREYTDVEDFLSDL